MFSIVQIPMLYDKLSAFRAIQDIFINIWRHTHFYHALSHNSGCCCILGHCRGSWCIFFMSFKLHILELWSTFGVIKRGKSFHKSGLFASLGVTSSNRTGLRVRKCWGIYFIQWNKHSLLLSGYSILIHCGVISKNTQQLCSFITVTSPYVLAVFSGSDCSVWLFNHACVATRRPSVQRRGGRFTAQLKMPMDVASAQWWHLNRISAPEMPKAVSFASSWRK